MINLVKILALCFIFISVIELFLFIIYKKDIPLSLQNHENINNSRIIDEPSANYSTEWYKNGFFKLSDYSYQVKECEPCLFTPRNVNPNSSPKDAVLISVLNMTYNIVPFTRSLRTTGCKASIVAFVDPASKDKLESDNLKAFIKNCGITLLNIGVISLSRNQMLLLRNALCYDFLRFRPNLFERILIVDLYDTIFQGDPFYTDFDTTSIGFSVETHRCDRGQIRNARYLLQNKASIFWKRKCINVGTIIGTYSQVLSFLSVYVEYLKKIPENILNSLDWIPDQVIINSLINTNYTLEKGLNIRLYRNDEQYAVLMNLFKIDNVTFDLGNFQAYPDAMYPFVVHLFDRSIRFCKSVKKHCPQTFTTPDSYIREINIYK